MNCVGVAMLSYFHSVVVARWLFCWIIYGWIIACIFLECIPLGYSALCCLRKHPSVAPLFVIEKKKCFNQAHYYREYADLFLSQTGINHPRSIMFNGQKFTPLSFQLPPVFLIDIISIETGYQLKMRKWIHQLLCLDRGVLKNTLTKIFFFNFCSNM